MYIYLSIHTHIYVLMTILFLNKTNQELQNVTKILIKVTAECVKYLEINLTVSFQDLYK